MGLGRLDVEALLIKFALLSAMRSCVLPAAPFSGGSLCWAPHMSRDPQRPPPATLHPAGSTP